jgi:hypothetical protein
LKFLGSVPAGCHGRNGENVFLIFQPLQNKHHQTVRKLYSGLRQIFIAFCFENYIFRKMNTAILQFEMQIKSRRDIGSTAVQTNPLNRTVAKIARPILRRCRMAKRILVLALCFLCVVGTVQAQKREMAGAKAFSFMLGGLDDLGLGRLDGGLGLKYWLSPSLALQPVLIFQSDKETTEDPYEEDTDHVLSSSTYGIELGIMKHMTFVNSLTPYIGIGVSYQMGKATEEYSIPKEDPLPWTLEKTEISLNTYGAALLLGAEWFVRSNIGIAIHYKVGYYAGSGSGKVTLVEDPSDPDVVEQPPEAKASASTMGIATSYYFIVNIYLP